MTSELRRLLFRFVSLFRRGAAETDLAREINAHLQLLEDRFVEEGMTRTDARWAAKRAFGGVEQAKELQRDRRSFRWLAGWPMDLKLGARMLAKSPGLTVIGVIALAAAIGAGAAYLEFIQDLIRPSLSGADDRLVGIRVFDVERSVPEPRLLRPFGVWRDHARTIELTGAALYGDRHLTTPDGRTDPARAAEISASAFRLMTAKPLLGRALSESDERAAADPVAVIGHDLWLTRFEGDPHVLGREARLGSTVYTIVGVMPEGFGFPVNENLWTPLRVQASAIKQGEGPPIQIFARLKEGSSEDAARAELQALLNADGPGAGGRATLRVDVRPYLDSFLADDRRSAEVKIAYAANIVFVMLLAICGANVATLVFARTAMREAEITVRTALGASRARISAQLFAEALVLSGAGALAGLMVARVAGLWATQLWIEAAGTPRPFWWDESLRPDTVLYAGALAVLAALMIGVVPALKATGAQLQGRLREAGAAASTMTLGWLWTAVIIMQAAVSVVVLATVVSLAWTVIRGQYGFDVTYSREHFLTARLVLDGARGTAGAPAGSEAETLHAIVDRLKREPGVVNATYATAFPGTTWEQFLLEFATPEAAAGAKFVTEVPWSQGAQVGVNFFETLGAALVAGRLFTDAEIAGAHPVAVVDETFVRTILGGRSPLGQMVRQPPRQPGGTPGPWHEIVGVVQDVTRMTRKGPDDAVLYRPAGTRRESDVRLLIRTRGPAAPMAHTLQSAALSVVPDMRVADVMSMDRLAAAEELPVHVFLRVFGVIAAVAMLLSTAGIYALISFTLARRTREIGIRIALGASPGRIITSVFSRAFTQIGIGVAAGAVPGVVIVAAGAEDAGRTGLSAGFLGTAAVCAFVVIVALIACAPPLRRALRIDPTQALRADG